MQTVLLWLAKISLGRKLLGLLSTANAKVSGKRSEIILGLEALIYVLSKIGVLEGIDPELLSALKVALLGALPVTLAEKVKTVQGQIDSVIPK